MPRLLAPLLLALLPALAQAEDPIRVYNWNDYIAPEVLEEFQKETGIKVEYHTFSSADELDKALAGGEPIDVAVPSHNDLPRLIKEGRLQPRTALLGFTVGHDRALAFAQAGEGPRRQRPQHVEIGVTVAGQWIKRPHHVRTLRNLDRNGFSERGLFEGLWRRGQVGRRFGLFAAGQDLTVTIQDVEGGIAEKLADPGQGPAEPKPVREDGLNRAKLAGHGHEVALKFVADVTDVAASDVGAVLNRRTDVLAEPALDAAVDQHAEHEGHEDRRHHGHQREQGHEAKVQARPGVLGLFADERQHAQAHRAGQHGDQQQVRQQDAEHHGAGAGQGPLPGSRGGGGDQPDAHGGDERRQAIGCAENDPGACARQPGERSPDPTRAFNGLRRMGGGLGHAPAIARLCPQINNDVARMRQAAI